MKKTIFLIAAILVCASVASADEYVKGYTRKDGTYVQPYHRSSPDSTLYNNYSSQGNTNPYTGEQGSERNELSNPPKYNSPYENLYNPNRR